MIYLYTTEPDKGCHEVEAGIYGRPVHTYEQKALKAKGWKEFVHELREEEGREEKEVKSDSDITNDFYIRDQYYKKYGKHPHHKMKAETIRKKLEESDD